MKKTITFFRLLPVMMLALLLTGSGVKAWAAVGDVIYTLPGGTGQPFGTINSYALKTGTYNSVAWTATWGSCNTASAFWLD